MTTGQQRMKKNRLSPIFCKINKYERSKGCNLEKTQVRYKALLEDNASNEKICALQRYR